MLSARVIAVARISATTQGLTPLRNAFTGSNFKKFLISALIIRIIINEGRTTPSVAHAEPKTSPKSMPVSLPSIAPTKVAIFTAIGPGVDSDTAIILSSSPSVSHPFSSTFSRTNEIIAYPPPKVKSPISKKVKKSSRNFILYSPLSVLLQAPACYSC